MSGKLAISLSLGVGIGVATFVHATASFAETVTLRMKGGGFEINGDLQAFDTRKYRIKSDVFGVMSLDATRFECIGENCPTGRVDGSQGIRHAALIPDNNPGGTVGIVGSNTIGNQLMPSLIQAYAEKAGLRATKVVGQDPLDLNYNLAAGPGGRQTLLELRRHGSSTSFRALEAGTAQIGMSSRPIKDKEVAALATKGLGDMRAPTHEHILGLDGLVIIVSEQNSATSISIENLQRIFSGDMTDWSELGLPAGPINIYAPTPDSGTFDTFKSLVLKPGGVELAQTAKRTENHAEQSDLVARDPNGIGVVGIAYQRNAKVLNIENSCGLISRPSRFSMKTEEYPLTRRLYLYTPGQPSHPVARGLLEFAKSDEAQSLVADADFIDQSLARLTFKEQAGRIAYALNASEDDFDMPLMRDLISRARSAERLSVTLRFATGGAQLDNKSRADLVRVRNELAKDSYDGKTVLIMGYADSVGAFEPNLGLSRKRALSVQSALLRDAPESMQDVKLETLAYSELAPVACNDTDAGRRFNRRVEIWVRD